MEKYLLALTNLEIFTSIENPAVRGRRKGGRANCIHFLYKVLGNRSMQLEPFLNPPFTNKIPSCNPAVIPTLYKHNISEFSGTLLQIPLIPRGCFLYFTPGSEFGGTLLQIPLIPQGVCFILLQSQSLVVHCFRYF